jgi:hypothetical protein
MISVRALVAVAACALAGGATAVETASAASAASSAKLSGTYVGVAVHPPVPGLEHLDPYEQKLALIVSKGALMGIVVEVRMQCPGDTIRDVEYHRLKIPEKKRPKLSKGGGFSFSKKGITISGSIGKHIADGRIEAHGDGCSVTNVMWTARKKKFYF